MQEYGICNLSLIPLRAEPSDRSEMTSQLLFGDHFEIIEKSDKWARIRTAYDGYEGWIDNKQFARISFDDYLALKDSLVLGLGISHQATKLSSNEHLHLVAGTSLPFIENNRLRINDEFYKVITNPVKPSHALFKEKVEEYARFYLGTPYLWGGRSIFGIDCSGFTQMVFKQFGVRLKRDAWQQAEQGELVGFLTEAKAGDLAFFDNEEGRIVHVGIMLDNATIIHASGRVRIDTIDNQGIYNKEMKRHTHKLRIIKRFIS